jgi:hypothetical protein
MKLLFDQNLIWLRRGNQPIRVIESMLRDQSDRRFEHDASACLEIY